MKRFIQVFIGGDCFADTGNEVRWLTQEGGHRSMLSMILPFVLLIAVFYFLLIRPENKKKKAAAKMRSELAVGDEITTIGGIVGTICAVKEDTIVIETGRRPRAHGIHQVGDFHQGHPGHGKRRGETKDSKDKK